MSTDGADDTTLPVELRIGSTEWLEQWRERAARAKQAAAQQLKAACPALSALGISSVVWRYDGYGDSGGIENVVLTGAGSAPKSLEALKEAFQGFDPDTRETLDWEAIEKAVCVIMPDGFENNEGGYGEVELTPATGRIQLRHNERVVETEYSEEEY